MYLEVAERVETLTYSDPGIISTPFGYKKPLRSRLREGLLLAIRGVFAVLLVIVMVLAILGTILHLPLLLLALAWATWKQRSIGKPATTETLEEQPIKLDDSSNTGQSFDRHEALAGMHGTRCRTRKSSYPLAEAHPRD